MGTIFASKLYENTFTSVEYVAIQLFLNHTYRSSMCKQENSWANVHPKCDGNQWDAVAVSDESTFTVLPTAQRKHIWREEGE